MNQSNYPYLKDSSFMRQVDLSQNKEQHIKITVLDFEEKPIQSIEGKVKSGSINLDGNSSVRRTCNPTIFVENYVEDFLNVEGILSINKKIFVEIGYTNNFSGYIRHNILWLPLGVFVIVNSNCTHSKEGTNISLQLKDKMCLLNGDCGGVIPAATTFHEVEEWSDNANDYVIKLFKIKDIIKELVNHLGGEQLDKIIINDIDDQVKQLVRWNGDNPVYIGVHGLNVFMDMDYDEVLNNLATSMGYLTETNKTLTQEQIKEVDKLIKKYSTGYDLGYFYTDFTYPGELICNAGETVCSVLDKIKNTLGNYEYYYDVYGNFIFQEIKNYLNTTQSTEILNKLKNGVPYAVNYWGGDYAYDFSDGVLVSSYSNNPQYNQIRNDFVVWGKRKDATGDKVLPIRYHLAIDTKPVIGNFYTVYIYLDKNEDDDDDPGIKRAKWIIDVGSGKKGKDISVVYKEGNKYYKYNGLLGGYEEISNKDIKTIKTYDWRSELYFTALRDAAEGKTSHNYSAEILVEWPKLYDIAYMGKDNELTLDGFYKETMNGTSIDYFLDFIEASSAVKGKYSVNSIGTRSKVVSDEKINCIFEPELPDLIFLNVAGNDFENAAEVEAEMNRLKEQGYKCIAADPFRDWLIGGGYFNSAYFLIQDLLYQTTDFNETISITSVPIYHLEPNTRIFVNDGASGIAGYYMLKSFSLPLDGKGTMTSSCTKVLNR